MLRRPSLAELSSSTMSKVAGALDSIDDNAIRINQYRESNVGSQTTRNSEVNAACALRRRAAQSRTNALDLDDRQNGGRCGIGGSWTRSPRFQFDWLSRNCQEIS